MDQVVLYAGWVTAACFINLSTALVDAAAVEADQVGIAVTGQQDGTTEVVAATLVGLAVVAGTALVLRVRER